MSEMQPPADEPSFAHYWAWVAREKVEQEVFRLMRTTPGIVDRSHVVEDVEAATKELVACRKEHLKDLLEGWDILEKTMNREIAVKVFNEFIAGSRTLEDFERINFSRKYRDQQGKPRSHFPAHLNGHPMLSQASISELHKNGVLPTTPTIYAANTAEYFEETATDKYYDLVFGDVRVFTGVLTKHNPSPNMPPAKAIPMPYHPRMDKQDKDFLKWHQITQPFIPTHPAVFGVTSQQPQMHMQPMQHMPFVGYPPMQPIQSMAPIQGGPPMQPVPAFIQVPVPMQSLPLPVPPQETTYAGTVYQKQPSTSNGNSYGTERRERGSQRGGYKGKNSRIELHGRYQNGHEFAEQAPSTSRSYRRYVEKEEPFMSQPQESIVEPESQEEAFPALDGQVASTTLSVDVTSAESQGSNAPAKAASVVLPTPRSFSDVVSHSVSATASTVDVSEPRGTVDEEEEDSNNRPSSSSVETPSGASDSRSVTSESVATTSEATATSSETTSASSKPSTSTSTPPSSAVPSSLPSTSELVIDTTEQSPPAVPQVSHKTVAEIVQQSLSAAPSPSSKRVNGVNSTQASPAVKSGTAASSPAQKGSRTAQTTPRDSQERTNTDNRKSARSPKKPSMSYAQMLYPKSAGESSKNKKQSSSLSSSTPSNSNSAQNALPTDWHTVRTGKKAADPAIVSPPAKTPPAVRKSIPQPVPEPVVSDEKDEEEGASDDPDADKRREQRRNKRQLIKSENRQKKQQQKELARQESLARVEKMNGESKKEKEKEREEGDEEKEPSPPPKPAFDRNDLAGRRKKRLELQRRSEMEANGVPTRAPSPPLPVIAVPPIVPINPLIPTKMGSAPMGAAITAGQTAMSAYGLNSPFRPRASPFSFITPNGTATLPLYLPPQDGIRTSLDGSFAGALLLEDPVEDKKYIPVQLIRNVDPVVVKPEKTEIDENADMVEKMLLFDSLEKIRELDLDPDDRSYVIRGLVDLKRMYSRVEKAGQLVSLKAGSSKVTSETEEKLLQLSIKLLSYRVDLNDTDNRICTELGGKIATTSNQFNYTNFITALVSFADERSKVVEEGSLRRGYEQIVVLTKVYLKRTKTLYEKIETLFDINNIKNEKEEKEDYNSLLL